MIDLELNNMFFEKSVKAENDISGLHPCAALVKRGTADDEFDLTSAATDVPLGAVGGEPNAGDLRKLQTIGLVKLKADGAISQDAEVIPSASVPGAVADQSGGVASDIICGRAVEAASDGESVWVFLYGPMYKTK